MPSPQLTLFLGLLLVAFSANVEAHPFHISIAEVEFNAKSARFEVSLKVQLADVEQAISAQANRKVNLEKDQDADRLLTDYITEHFFLTGADNIKSEGSSELLDSQAKRSVVHFVGRETKSTWLWLYFELQPPAAATAESVNDLALVNTILLNDSDGQINTVSVRDKNEKHSFKTTLKQPWAKMPSRVDVK